MEQYGWTLTEVRDQPYLKLLEILNEDSDEESEENKANKR